MWKFSTFSEFAFYVLLLLALTPAVNSNETPTPRMCAVCLDKDCATGVRRIYPAGSDTPVWPKANSPTAIQSCSMENLKADAPCKMANGGLVLPADLDFEGIDTHDERRTFDSQISPCADLYLPPSSTLSPVTKAPKIPEADKKDCIGIGILIISIVISIVISMIIGIIIGSIVNIIELIRKCCIRLKGQYSDLPQGSSGVPPHDAEDRNKNTMEKQPPNAEVPNENVNGVHREDDSVGPENNLDIADDTPV